MTKTNQTSEIKSRVAISLGDPAGIGIEVILKALGSSKLPTAMQPILIGCRKTVQQIYSQLKLQGIKALADPKHLDILDLPLREGFNPGHPNANTGEASFDWLTRATELLINKQARALVTGPISKNAWNQAGHPYPGQTERIAEMAGSKNPSMLFTAISPKNSWRLNTLLATTHIPLSEVPKHLCPELIISKLNTLMNFCQRFHTYPKLAVAGLNPHSGENGILGNEEIEWLIPTLMKWKSDNKSILLEGPIPPDTCWISASKAWQGISSPNSPNGILALYHDQGLIPIKTIAFEEAVNTTLGLPFIRTSPDHGTGFDIAGKGIANETSMLAALQAAWEFTAINT